MDELKQFKSKCYMCLKSIEPQKESYALIGIFQDNYVNYDDPVRKAYLKHYLDREYNLCIPCYQKVINFMEESKSQGGEE